MNREQIQRMISDLQVYRWRVINYSSDLTRSEKQNMVWWLNKEIADLFEDLNTMFFRKAG